jgi:hypothetical protein
MSKKLLKGGIQLTAIIVIVVAISTSASACWPYGGYSGGWWGGNGYYSTYSQESVPYYALNPPVYYSYPVSRTYGLYPFPYYADASYSSAPVNVVEPKMVMNRYVEQKLTAKANPLECHLLRIANPFVDQPAESNSAERANWEVTPNVKPKVVYPIKLTSTN